MKIWIIQVLGIIVHFMLILSVYDVQRSSDSFQGFWINCTNQPISRRLVLIIHNGLNGKSLFNDLGNHSLLQEIKTSGVWGVAVRKNLLETSGIVSITSGFEEQSQLYSHIYKGKKKEYDHIFNYASKTYYFGNPDIPKEYKKSSERWTKSLSQHGETIPEMIEKAFSNDTTHHIMSNLIIFVHLPESASINSFDEFLLSLTKTIEQIFKDNESIYIVCSDKTEEPKQSNNSETLFLMWGARVAHRSNVTLNITDISPMISGILGNPNPISSIGIWQTGFFNISQIEETKAKACNALHLASIARTVLEQVGNKILKKIGLSHSNDEEMLEEHRRKLSSHLASNNDHKITTESSNDLIELSMHIIKKDLVFIQKLITLLMHFTYIGWSLLLLTKIMALSISRDATLKHEIKIQRRKTELWYFGLHTVLLLIGGLGILFVIIQSWPIYYVMYLLPTLVIWGSIINNIQNWIGFINKLYKRKSIIILFYLITYGITIEAYYWGLSYSTVAAVHVACVSILNIGICIANNEYIGIKITMISVSLLLIGIVYIPLKDINLSPVVLISSGLVWPTAGILSAFYMWFSAEIIDSIVMIASLTHYCTAFIITIISIFHTNLTSLLIVVLLFAIGYILPLFGKAVIPAAEVPLNYDRYRKSNRIQHVSLCTSSLLLLFSIAYEPLFAFIVYVFSLMWIFITEPKIKMETINFENGHYAMTFTMLIMIIQHILGLYEQPRESMFIIKHSLATAEDIVFQIFYKIKIYLPVFIVQFIFTSLALSSGGVSQLLLAYLIQNLFGYRLFLGMDEFYKYDNSDKKIMAHTSLQTIMMLQFITQQLVQILLHASVLKMLRYLRSMLHRIRQSINRR